MPIPPRLSRFTFCTDFVVISEPRQSFYSTVTVPSATSTPAVINQGLALPFKPRTLESMAAPLRMYQVVDLSTRLLFHDYISYTSFRTATSVPAYVPKQVGLVCLMPEASSHQLPRVLEILPWCHVVEIKNVMTQYHRPCKQLLLQTCVCTGGNFLVDHVHNSCIGRNNSQYRKYRLPIWDIHANHTSIVPSKDERCSLETITKLGAEAYSPQELKKVRFTVSFRIAPLLRHYGSVRVNKSKDIIGPGLPEFAVEFINTLEQGFRCPMLRSYLKDCRLVKCVAGALLWIEDFEPTARSCILPTEARIFTGGDSSLAVPVCTCLKIVAALNGMGLWEAKLEGDFNTECRITLVLLPARYIDFNEIYEFAKQDVTSTGEKEQIDSRALSRLLANLSQFCPGEIHQAFEICFFTTSVGNTTDSTKCMRWSWEDAHKTGGSGPESKALRNVCYVTAVVLSLWLNC